jgi:fructokinase
MISAVGADQLGDQALQELTQRGVDISCVQQSAAPTGQVHIQLDAHGVASYRFLENTAWDHLEWSPQLAAAAAQCEAVCFGTLGQRSQPSREVIQQFLRAVPPSCLRVFDINLRPPYWSPEVVLSSLPLANVLKCNEEEFPILMDLIGGGGADRECMARLVERFQLRLMILTRGAAGSVLLDNQGQWSELPSEQVRIVDTVGAGDAFTAAVTLGLLNEATLREFHQWATRVAGYVCTQPGGTPTFPAELRRPA